MHSELGVHFWKSSMFKHVFLKHLLKPQTFADSRRWPLGHGAVVWAWLGSSTAPSQKDVATGRKRRLIQEENSIPSAPARAGAQAERISPGRSLRLPPSPCWDRR